jgi:hypothetical protein
MAATRSANRAVWRLYQLRAHAHPDFSRLGFRALVGLLVYEIVRFKPATVGNKPWLLQSPRA